MRSGSVDLVNLINGNMEFVIADLFTFTLVGGYVARYTSADIDIVFNGQTFQRFAIEREQVRFSCGIQDDELDITVYANETDLLNGIPWLHAINRGALDDAQVIVQRAYLPNWASAPVGALDWFSGTVAPVSGGRTTAKIKVKSDTSRFNVQLPRNPYQSGCLNTLFDNGCGLNRASFAVTGTVSSGTVTQINTALAQASGYFALGVIRFDSGVNAGISRTVRNFASGAFVLARALVSAPAAGDTFTAWPGCDRTKATCESSKFGNNVVHFRGYPFVPDPETAT